MLRGRVAATPEPALVLALLRIAVALLVLIGPEAEIARTVAARDPALWIRPEGLGWLGSVVPLSSATATIAGRVVLVSAVLVLAGAWTRAALVVLAASLLYVSGAAQLTGTVTHDMHLFWLTALLAATPSASGPGAALSVDAFRRRSFAGPAPTFESSLAVLVARVWLGLVYFFPGVQKLAHGGLGWISAESLRGQMYFKWYEGGGVPPWPRIDRVPHLLDIAAGGVVAFELTMPVLVVSRRTRPLAAVLGLAFHFSAGHFLDVLFPSLIACYVLLVPGERARELAERLLPRATTRSSAALRPSSERPLALALVATAFTAGIVIAGARGQTQGFPFACYPTFADRAPDEIVDLAVDVVGPGPPLSYRLPRRRRQDEWGLVWRLAGLYGDPVDGARLHAFARAIVPEAAIGGRLRWMIETYDVAPEAYGAPPRRRWMIHEN